MTTRITYLAVAVPVDDDARIEPCTLDESPFSVLVDGITYDTEADEWVEADEADDTAAGAALQRVIREREQLDALAELFRLPEWRVDGSGASFIEACAEVVGRVRNVRTAASLDSLRQYGYEDEAIEREETAHAQTCEVQPPHSVQDCPEEVDAP